jgi:hypothetical protein
MICGAAPGNPDPHIDALQIPPGTATANVLIQHNNFDVNVPGINSCVMMQDVKNIDFDNNRLDGGGYCIYFERTFVPGDVTNNVFTGNFVYGYAAGDVSAQNWRNNTFKGVAYPTGYPWAPP